MKKLFYTSLISLLALCIIQAQDVETTTHDFDGFHSFPSDIFISKDGQGDVWVLQVGGFDGSIISRYSDGQWENVPFDLCTHCVFNLETDNNGVLYASTGMGFFAWENDTWTAKSDDVTGREDFVFDEQNRLWFEHEEDPVNLAVLNTDGTIEKITEIEGDVSDLSFGTDGLLWFVNNQEIVSIATDGTNINRYPIFPDNMETGKNGRTYYTDFTGDLSYIEGGLIFDNQYPNADNGFAITSLGVDVKYDYMWLGNQGLEAGITLLNLETGESKFINGDILFSDNPAPLTTEMFIAEDGTLWAAVRFDGRVVEVDPDYISSTATVIEEDFTLFPNPVTDHIQISSTVEVNNGIVDIYDQLGNKVKQIRLNGGSETSTIDLSNLNSGIYFIKFGNKNTLKKLIKI